MVNILANLANKRFSKFSFKENSLDFYAIDKICSGIFILRENFILFSGTRFSYQFYRLCIMSSILLVILGAVFFSFTSTRVLFYF